MHQALGMMTANLRGIEDKINSYLVFHGKYAADLLELKLMCAFATLRPMPKPVFHSRSSVAEYG